MNIQILNIPILIYFGLISLQILETNTNPVLVTKKITKAGVSSVSYLKMFDQDNRLRNKLGTPLVSSQGTTNISWIPKNTRQSTVSIMNSANNTTKSHRIPLTNSYRTSTTNSERPMKMFRSFNQRSKPSNNSGSIQGQKPEITPVDDTTEPNPNPHVRNKLLTVPQGLASATKKANEKAAEGPRPMTNAHINMVPKNKGEPRSRETVKLNPPTGFNPATNTPGSVCLGSTIPYGEHKIMRWLDRHMYKSKHSKRPFYNDLRRKMFFDANSEECHTPDLTDWDEYQNCALRRNQRMEFNVPQYPVHQLIKD